MPSLIIDDALLAQLSQATGQVSIANRAGEIVGIFVPTQSNLRTYPESGLTDMEIDQRSRDKGGRPATELLNELRKRK
jgi:hypothetical protein